MDKKIRDLENLLSSSSSKKEVQNQIQEMNMEIDEDLTNLTDLLDKMPNMISALNATVLEMQLGSTPGEDYEEKKEEINEMLEELEIISTNVEKYIEDLIQSKELNESIKKQAKKSQSLENLQKVASQLANHKNKISSQLTDALDS